MLVSPRRNQSSSWMIDFRCSFLVVTRGKPAPRSKRIWWPNTLSVPVPVRSVLRDPLRAHPAHQVEVLLHGPNVVRFWRCANRLRRAAARGAAPARCKRVVERVAEEGDAQAARSPQQPGEIDANQEHLDDACQRIADVQRCPQPRNDERGPPEPDPRLRQGGEQKAAEQQLLRQRRPDAHHHQRQQPVAAADELHERAQVGEHIGGNQEVLNNAHPELQGEHEGNRLGVDRRRSDRPAQRQHVPHLAAEKRACNQRQDDGDALPDGQRGQRRPVLAGWLHPARHIEGRIQVEAQRQPGPQDACTDNSNPCE